MPHHHPLSPHRLSTTRNYISLIVTLEMVHLNRQWTGTGSTRWIIITQRLSWLLIKITAHHWTKKNGFRFRDFHKRIIMSKPNKWCRDFHANFEPLCYKCQAICWLPIVYYETLNISSWVHQPSASLFPAMSRGNIVPMSLFLLRGLWWIISTPASADDAHWPGWGAIKVSKMLKYGTICLIWERI